MRLVRERDVEQLFVILGASRAGKSSFLRAGLLPRLKRDSEHFVVLLPIRPERAAISGSQGLLNSLKLAIAAAGQAMSPAQLRAELTATGLAGVLRRISPAVQPANGQDRLAKPTLIVPIDQAEELFGSDGQDEARQFLGYVEGLRKHLSPADSPVIDSRRLRVLLVLTIRSDSLPKLQAQAALQTMLPVLFSLPAMPVSEFKAVIEGPARRYTATVKPLVVAPQLTEQLVVDAQGADALPLLALSLEWLYREFTNAQGTRVGYDEYQRLGGVRGVIGMAVEPAFERPGSEPAIPAQKPEQERLLQQVFPYLATVDPDTGDWKRRVALREAIRGKLPQADALVSRPIEQRLLVADSRRLTDGTEPVEVVEVAYEALLRQWDAMERWLREFGAALSESESIRRAANDWQRGSRDEALLVHTAHRLKAGEVLLSDERLEGRFEAVDGKYLAACRERDRRELEEREEQLRRIAEQQVARAALLRRVTWGLSAAALFVLGLSGWMGMQARTVSQQHLPGADNRGGNRSKSKAVRPKPLIWRTGGQGFVGEVRTRQCATCAVESSRCQYLAHVVDHGRHNLRKLQPRRQARGHSVPGQYCACLEHILVVAGPAGGPDRRGMPAQAARQCPKNHRGRCARGQDSVA